MQASARGERVPAGLRFGSVGLGAVFVVPIGYLLVRNLGEGFAGVFERDAVAPLGRTLALATTVSCTTSVVGTMLAWLVVRTDLPGRRFWRLVAPLPLVVPSFVGAFCFLAAFTDGGLVERYVLSPLGIDASWRIEGFGWSVLVLTLFTYPYVYLPVAARLAALPRSIEESARVLGRTPRRTFVEVVLPQVKGAIVAGALLVFLYSLSDFGAVQLLRYDTLTRSIYAATQSFDERSAFGSSLLLAAAAIAVVVGERRWSERSGRREAHGVGRDPVRYRLGRGRLPAAGAVGGVLTAALFAPVAVLVQWTVRGIVNGTDLHAERLGPATLHSAQYGVVGAAIAVVLVLPAAYLTVRYPTSWWSRVVNAMITSAFALPGLVLGFAFVNVALADRVPELLYQSTTLLIVAYVVHFGVQALRANQVAVGGVPPRLGEAARSLGARPLERMWRIDLPLMRSGLAAGGGLVMLSIMKELPVTLLLHPSETDTLTIQIFSATDSAFYAQAGLFALVLVALSATLTWFVTIRPLDRDGRL